MQNEVNIENEREILANIDAALASILIKNLGYTQAKVAKQFCTTPATISHYRSKVRGRNINFSDEINNAIRQLANLLNANNKLSLHELRKHRYDILLFYFKDKDKQKSRFN
jgi:predicted transcriptional regulator